MCTTEAKFITIDTNLTDLYALLKRYRTDSRRLREGGREYIVIRCALTTAVMTHDARTGTAPPRMTHHVLGDPMGSISVVFKGYDPERFGPILS